MSTAIESFIYCLMNNSILVMKVNGLKTWFLRDIDHVKYSSAKIRILQEIEQFLEPPMKQISSVSVFYRLNFWWSTYQHFFYGALTIHHLKASTTSWFAGQITVAGDVTKMQEVWNDIPRSITWFDISIYIYMYIYIYTYTHTYTYTHRIWLDIHVDFVFTADHSDHRSEWFSPSDTIRLHFEGYLGPFAGLVACGARIFLPLWHTGYLVGTLYSQYTH